MDEETRSDLVKRLHCAWSRGIAGADNENYQCSVTLRDLRAGFERIEELQEAIAYYAGGGRDGGALARTALVGKEALARADAEMRAALPVKRDAIIEVGK